MTEPQHGDAGGRADLSASTLEQQASLTIGASAWRSRALPEQGVPDALFADGPHGVRKPHEQNESSLFDSLPATCFPTAASLGASWDRRLLQDVGVALGREARAAGVDVLLGPGLNLKRDPTGGRNFEYFAEDPTVIARLGTSFVDGLQSTGVGASVKHFVANDTEQRRYGIDVRVDDRALRELYLAAFEQPIIEARPATVMAAYSRLDGTHCTEHRWLLTELLRDEWGYRGAVVSDWGAAWDRSLSVPAGLDLEMPGLGGSQALVRAVRRGRVRADAVRRAAERVAALAARSPSAPAEPADLDAHHALARRAASAGSVLLRNSDGLLPLRSDGAVAVLGAFATAPRYQGAGSSHVVPTRLTSLLESLRERLGAEAVHHAAGYALDEDGVDAALLAEAVAVAQRAESVVVVIGLPESYETEGVDRSHLRLPASHDALVRAVAAAHPRVAVVLQNGSPVEMPWRDEVGAILETHLSGQAGGEAAADVLLGVAEPGGRLAETFPLALADHPSARIGAGVSQLEYRESLYVGYRYFDAAGAPVAYPFGHGLSYTEFDWSDLTIHDVDAVHADVSCSIRVTNVGTRRGSDVVQLYVHPLDEAPVFRPEQELRAFEKVELDPGESTVVRFELDRRAFAYWATAPQRWTVPGGRYELRASASSRRVRAAHVVALHGDDPVAAPPGQDAYRAVTIDSRFGHDDFARLYARPLPTDSAPLPGRCTLDTALRDMDASVVGRALVGQVRRQAVAALGIPETPALQAVTTAIVGQFTLRMLPTISGGAVSRRLVPWLLRLVNLTSPPRWPGASDARRARRG